MARERGSGEYTAIQCKFYDPAHTLTKTDKPSGIVNDPNDWADEHDDPRYIVDFIGRVTTVAVETMRIVDSLDSGGGAQK